MSKDGQQRSGANMALSLSSLLSPFSLPSLPLLRTLSLPLSLSSFALMLLSLVHSILIPQVSHGPSSAQLSHLHVFSFSHTLLLLLPHLALTTTSTRTLAHSVCACCMDIYAYTSRNTHRDTLFTICSLPSLSLPFHTIFFFLKKKLELTLFCSHSR